MCVFLIAMPSHFLAERSSRAMVASVFTALLQPPLLTMCNHAAAVVRMLGRTSCLPVISAIIKKRIGPSKRSVGACAMFRANRLALPGESWARGVLMCVGSHICSHMAGSSCRRALLRRDHYRSRLIHFHHDRSLHLPLSNDRPRARCNAGLRPQGLSDRLAFRCGASWALPWN